MKKIALATAILIASAGAFAQGAKNEAPANPPAADAKQDSGMNKHHKKEHHKRHHDEGKESKGAESKGANPATPATPATPAAPSK